MDMLRALIVDDERPARAKVRRLLSGIANVDVVGEASDGQEAVDRIRQLKPDVVILDIQMPGKTGFEVIASLDGPELPYVVFATAYDQHAIQAFDVAAVDYLLKPFNRERLGRALERVRARLSNDDDKPKYVDELLTLLDAQKVRHLERVAVESRGRKLIIRVADIGHLEAEGNYVSIYSGGKSYLCRGSLASYEERLDPRQFVRVHRSALVNVERIREMKSIARGDQLLVLDDGSEVRMSRRYRERLTELLDL